MGIKSFCKPPKSEEKRMKNILKKCPDCGGELRKTGMVYKCKSCGKLQPRVDVRW